MRILDRISSLFASQLGLNDDDSAALDYGLQVALLQTGGIALVLAAGWLLGCLAETAAATLTLFVTRSFAGGAHCTSAGRCMAVTVLIFSLLGSGAHLLSTLQFFDPPSFVLLVFPPVLAVFLLRAPLDSPQKPINAAGHRRRLKMLSVAALVALTAAQLLLLRTRSPWAGGAVSAGGLGLLWQGLILTRPGVLLLSRLDRMLAKVL